MSDEPSATIGEDTFLMDAEEEYLADAITTLKNEVFVDGLGYDHFRALDENNASREEWQEYVRRMGDAGFNAISVPEEYGGPGGTITETVLAEQVIGYCGNIVHACQTSLTQYVGRTMYEHGDQYVKETYLKPMAAGNLVVAQAYTEPRSGTDIAHLETTAEQNGDEWVINGEKRFIDFAPYADFYFTPVRTSGEDGDRDGVSLIVIDHDSDGIELLQDQSDRHGFRGTGASWMRFDDVRVPEENLVGNEGEAWSYITDELNLEHLTVARYCLGASQQALEIAANYTASREVNKRPVSRYQAVNHKVAEMVTRFDGTYLLNTRAAWIMDDRGVSAGRMESAMAKWLGNEQAHEIADTCIQIIGGIGTTTSFPIEQIQRDVRAGRFMGGATEVMKSVVQHDAYKRLLDEEFDADLVGNEREGLPWLNEDQQPTRTGDEQ